MSLKLVIDRFVFLLFVRQHYCPAPPPVGRKNLGSYFWPKTGAPNQKYIEKSSQNSEFQKQQQCGNVAFSNVTEMPIK